ncbi:MAG: helix-turn-helix domain-containing protein [Planctomycetia bacterium]|nr:helix-turn-helix domain-containing protein [Planctomycetia bacterium]
MPRYRSTTDGAATLVGKLLLLIAESPETSATLAAKLNVSSRQVNRYILQLIAAGWLIEREGEWLRHDYHFVLKSPRIVMPAVPQSKIKRPKKKRAKKSDRS